MIEQENIKKLIINELNDYINKINKHKRDLLFSFNSIRHIFLCLLLELNVSLFKKYEIKFRSDSDDIFIDSESDVILYIPSLINEIYTIEDLINTYYKLLDNNIIKFRPLSFLSYIKFKFNSYIDIDD